MYIKTALFVAILFSFADSAYAQTERVILSTREISIGKAFDEITSQTPYEITVDWNTINQNRTVMLSGNVLTVGDLLRQSLTGTGYTYEVDGKQITLKAGRLNDSDTRHTIASYDVGMIEPGRRIGSWSSKGDGGESIEIVMVNFRVNRSLLMRDFMGNRYALDILDRTLSNPELVADMDYITITGAASPEGNTAQNEKLAYDRAMAIKSYIMWKYPYLDRNRILIYSVGEDWAGLRKMVEDDTATPGRYEILELLNSNITNDTRKARLRTIDKGRAYTYIAKNMLPYLRGGAACMIYYKNDRSASEEATEPAEPEIRYVDRVRVDTIFINRDRITEVPVEVVKSRKPYYMAVKTNLLYDVMLLPNLALEFSLPRRWSMELEGHWSWWNTGSGKHYYHRIQAVGLEVRKWLGTADRIPLTGHYIGVYGMGGDYDLRFGNTGYLCATGSWSAGVSYGYSKPIGRSFNLEFGIGAGYVSGDYKKYVYDSEYDRYPWQSDHKTSYFGITKAKVSLVWLVGSGKNGNKKR